MGESAPLAPPAGLPLVNEAFTKPKATKPRVAQKRGYGVDGAAPVALSILPVHASDFLPIERPTFISRWQAAGRSKWQIGT